MAWRPRSEVWEPLRSHIGRFRCRCRPGFAARLVGRGRAEVRKSDRRQHTSCAMWRSPQRTTLSRSVGQSRRLGLRSGATSGTASSHPVAGLTGNTRSATGAQGRSRRPCRRTEVRPCTAGRSPCVSAMDGSSTPPSGKAASVAAARARELGQRVPRAGPLTPCSGAPGVEATGEGKARSGRAMARVAAGRRRVERERRCQPVVRPRGAPSSGKGPPCPGRWRSRAPGVTPSPLEGLACWCAMHAVRQLNRAEASPVSARSGPLASAKSAD